MSKNKYTPFTENKKYHRWYFAIVDRARDRKLDDYTEEHHIIPRSLGGGNEQSNLVDLTFREHFLVHWLLIKMTEGEARRKMCTALHWMCYGAGNKKGIRIAASGWQYDTARRAAYDAQIGTKHSSIRVKRMSVGIKAAWANSETKEKARASWAAEREERTAAITVGVNKPEAREKHLAAIKRNHADAIIKERHLVAMRQEETREKMRASSAIRWARSGEKEKTSRATKAAMARPEVRAKILPTTFKPGHNRQIGVP